MTTELGELSGAWNFRDVAEETAIRPGLLYRSSQLSQLSDAGRAVFRRLGITDVADLRSHQEVQRQGTGQVPDGVAVHLLPFHPDSGSTQDAPHENTFQRVMSESVEGEDVATAARRYRPPMSSRSTLPACMWPKPRSTRATYSRLLVFISPPHSVRHRGEIMRQPQAAPRLI